ncbi:MAG: hypothetical protein ACRDA5_01895 [Clostridium sp.]
MLLKGEINNKLTAFIAFIIVNIVSSEYYKLLVGFFAMSTDSELTEVSFLNLEQIFTIIVICVVMIVLASIPHIVAIVVFKLINYFKKEFLSIKFYRYLLLPIYIYIIIGVILVHGDF